MEEKNWVTITDAMALVVSPGGTAASAHLNGIDFAGKTGSAQTVSNELKKKMSASDKSKFKDNGWFVGVTPRRNPELVVAVLLEEGEHGFFAARAASQVIKAYVEKQRTRQTLVAQANGGGSKKAEVAGVWHDGNSQSNPTQPNNNLQGAHFSVDASGKVKPVSEAPGVAAARSTADRNLQATESHTEMAEPEAEPATPPEQPALRNEGERPTVADPKKPAVKPGPPPAKSPAEPGTKPAVSPAALVIPERHP